MQIVTVVSTGEGLDITAIEGRPKNMKQVLEVLEYEVPTIFSSLGRKEYSVVLQKDKNLEEFIQWLPGTDYEEFNFDAVYFLEIIEGSITTLTALIAWVASYVTAITGIVGTMATIIAAVIVVGVYVGIMIGIGALIQALSPNQTREGVGVKNLLLGELPNLQGQGYYIPLNLGTYMCGGIRIADKITSFSWTISGTNDVPELPEDLPSITKANLPNIQEGIWYKLKAS